MRRDLFTCEKIIRPLSRYASANGRVYYEGNTDPNGNSNVGCSEDFTKCNIGFVGVNNTSPTEQLDVIGNIKSSHNFIGKAAEISSIVYDGTIRDAQGNATGKNSAFKFQTQEVSFSGNIFANGMTANNLELKSLNLNGDFKLKNLNGQNVFAVYQNGDVRARKTTVDLLPIPDYVFKKDYKLMNLKELELYISQNNHLPNIKSEAEYKQAGEIDLGELNLKLLEKVEELTLYTINQQKQIDELKKMILELKK